jgi:hypothetical protein
MDTSSAWHGFLNGGATINYPGARNTYTSGINDDSQVIGYYDDTAGNLHGFLQNSGQYYSFDYQGAAGVTVVRGTNGLAQVVGIYGASNNTTQGFTLQLTPPQWTAGSFNALSYPGANLTFAMGMNNNGQAVGSYYPIGSGPFAFLYDSNTKAYGTISNSGWFNVQMSAINDAAQTVGTYSDSQGVVHGFIATP